MINFIADSISFSEALENGKTLERTYDTFPYRVFHATTSIQGLQYRNFNNENYKFQTITEILSPYLIKVKIKFKSKLKEFDNSTDATIYYTVFLKKT